MSVYDARCKQCDATYEYRGPSYQAPGSCPECGSDDTKIIWLPGSFPNTDRAGDPYDMLDGHIPDPKPIKSFANDKRKGGKDTT